MKILLIEDDADYAYLLIRMLSIENSEHFEITHARRVSEAIQYLLAGHFDAILSDLSLPDSDGLDTFTQINQHAQETPIVVLTAIENEAMALRADREAAQNYLVKVTVNNKVLLRSLRFAYERQKARTMLQRLSMLDDLTGLYNRRAFNSMAVKYLQLAQRNHQPAMLLFADLDGLKHINDVYGHQEGDRALIEIGNILKNTCREADIVARISGDEFAVLAMNITPDSTRPFLDRLYSNLAAQNLRSNLDYTLSISFGLAYYDQKSTCTIDELLSNADAAMYVQKHSKRESAAETSQAGSQAQDQSDTS